MLKGIDISSWQEKINWDKVKPQIEFAIIRVGYGSDIANQDDKYAERNMCECERLGIPYGVYLYSYATTTDMIDSEVKHTLRVVGNHKPFCIYIDMEDAKTAHLGKTTLTAFAKQFCEAVKAKGFKVGVYANQNWFKNYLNCKELYDAGYSIWAARYSTSEPNIAAPYDIWQHTSSGKVDGVPGNVDMNKMVVDIITKKEEAPAPAKKTIAELVNEVLAGKWGNGEDRKKRITAAGYNYSEVQAAVNKKCAEASKPAKKTVNEIAKEVINGKWGNGADRKKRLADAGYNYSEVQAAVNKMLK